MSGEKEKKLFIETYGCQMNVADSEVIASVMKIAGYEPTDAIEDADAVFLNTCSIRDNAEQKIFSRLDYFASLRKKRKSRLVLGVLGCMAERVKDELIANHGVDIVAGPDAYLSLPDLVGCRTWRKSHQHPTLDHRDLPRRHPATHRAQPHKRIYQHHARMQQLLLLLHRALCPRPGAQPRPGEDHRRGPGAGGRGI